MLEPHEIFVGRAREQEVFRKMLHEQGRGDVWVMNIYDGGGIGKTWLLRKLAEICDEEGAKRTEIIDFYEPVNRHRVGLIKSISASLGLYKFPELADALETYDETVRAEEIRRAEEEVITRFFESYKQLSEGELRTALLLDTFDDEVKDTDSGRWLLSEFLPGIKGASPTVVVIAGRGPIDLKERQEKEVKAFYLEEFTVDDTVDYFKQRGEGLETLDREEIAELRDKANGRPILIAVITDWLTVGKIAPSELLRIPARDFEKELMGFIFTNMLSDPQRQVISYMAHLYHRFDREVLEALFGEEEPGYDVNEVFSQLSSFSFVKYREQIGSCLLHDETRDLARQHILPSIDPTGELRREWSRGVVSDYYDPRIEAERDKITRQVLTAESIYHQLYADLKLGTFWHHLDDAWRGYELDYMEILLGMAESVNQDRRSPDARLQSALDTGRGWLFATRGQPERARSLFQKVLGDPQAMKRLRATAFMGLGECARLHGEDEEAVENLEEALQLYDELGRGEERPSEKGVITTRKGISAERFFILNTLGIIRRSEGRLEEALDYYKQALKASRDANDVEWIAASLNNIGNVYRIQRKIPDAFDYCGLAVDRRRELGYQRDIALSYNTIGMVYRDNDQLAEAKRYTQMARDIFEELGDNEFLARAIINLGWISRHERNYRQALEYYEQALQICRQFDVRSQLPRLLNKMGRAYHDQGDWEQAENYYEESLEVARDTGNMLFEAVNLESLTELEYQRGDITNAREHAADILKLADQGYQFGIAFGEAELILGHLDFDRGRYLDAFEHYGRGYAHLAGFSERSFEKRLGILREQFRELPPDWRRKCSKQLIEFWEQEELDESHDALVQLARRYGAAGLANELWRE